MTRTVQQSLQQTLMCLLLLLTGCSTTGAIQQAHWHFLSGDTTAAVNTLASTDDVSSKDQLLYWLEKGMYLHYAGDYENSTLQLLEAANFLEESDYISLTEETRELLANEWASSYRGEYSERLWVHSILMMNFLHLGKYESAAVEARRALELIGSRTNVLNEDHFTRALIALSFEVAGQINDSYIVNTSLANDKHTQALNPILLQQASRLGFSEDAIRLRKNTGKTETRHTNEASTAIIFVPSGLVPQKVSGSLITTKASRLSFPEYSFAPSQPDTLTVQINGKHCECPSISSDLGELVSRSLQKRALSLSTKALLRAAAKDAVADAVADTDELVGGIARILLFALEEADTRSWRSLPRHFSMVRVPLPAGREQHEVKIYRSKHSGIEPVTVTITPDQNSMQFYSLLPRQFR